MDIVTLITLAIGLSMDAFAVAVCKGLAMKKITVGKAAIVGLWFGGFQALMPLIGYFLGVQFKDKITSVDHWIAFVLLALIGLNMIREALGKDDEGEECSECGESGTLKVKEMFVLAVATSIDALAVGVTFAFLQVNIWAAVSSIGLITFALSMVGVKVGNVFGVKYKARAELAGGIILILLGLKILLEHLGVL
ncbi:MAG: manganese efflux pump [Clostridiales bacterium]|nr:manganese efflux pump [Clostridiales bacterium]